jgi:putative heme-binding domain-containing protein
MPRSSFWLALLPLICSAPAAGAQGAPLPLPTDSLALAQGRTLFESQCARCHGIGGGGGAGPSLRRPRLRRAADDSALVGLIRDGVAGTPMPGAWQLGDRELGVVAAYVRSLGRLPAEPLPGDSARGRELFAVRAGCAGCHTVAGVGGVTGPELTEIGAVRNIAYLRESLLDPGAAQPVRTLFTYPTGDYAGYLVVRVVTAGGRAILGRRINEDPFTIQLRDVAGRLYSFDKRSLRSVERRPTASLMPAFGEHFTPAELDDLVSYLASLRGDTGEKKGALP